MDVYVAYVYRDITGHMLLHTGPHCAFCSWSISNATVAVLDLLCRNVQLASCRQLCRNVQLAACTAINIVIFLMHTG